MSDAIAPNAPAPSSDRVGPQVDPQTEVLATLRACAALRPTERTPRIGALLAEMTGALERAGTDPAALSLAIERAFAVVDRFLAPELADMVRDCVAPKSVREDPNAPLAQLRRALEQAVMRFDQGLPAVQRAIFATPETAPLLTAYGFHRLTRALRRARSASALPLTPLTRYAGRVTAPVARQALEGIVQQAQRADATARRKARMAHATAAIAAQAEAGTLPPLTAASVAGAIADARALEGEARLERLSTLAAHLSHAARTSLTWDTLAAAHAVHTRRPRAANAPAADVAFDEALDGLAPELDLHPLREPLRYIPLTAALRAAIEADPQHAPLPTPIEVKALVMALEALVERGEAVPIEAYTTAVQQWATQPNQPLVDGYQHVSAFAAHRIDGLRPLAEHVARRARRAPASVTAFVAQHQQQLLLLVHPTDGHVVQNFLPAENGGVALLAGWAPDAPALAGTGPSEKEAVGAFWQAVRQSAQESTQTSARPANAPAARPRSKPRTR